MSADYLVSEPFPLFVDSTLPSSTNYLSSTMSALNMLNSSSVSRLRKSIAVPAKFDNFVRLRYYQYEVTFGLYVMEPMEKLIFNTIVLGIFATLLFGLYFGLQSFLVRSICKLLWYLTGSHEGVEDLCTWNVPAGLRITKWRPLLKYLIDDALILYKRLVERVMFMENERSTLFCPNHIRHCWALPVRILPRSTELWTHSQHVELPALKVKSSAQTFSRKCGKAF